MENRFGKILLGGADAGGRDPAGGGSPVPGEGPSAWGRERLPMPPMLPSELPPPPPLGLPPFFPAASVPPNRWPMAEVTWFAIPPAVRRVMAILATVPPRERTISPVLAVFSPKIRSRVSAFWANFRKAYPMRKLKTMLEESLSNTGIKLRNSLMDQILRRSSMAWEATIRHQDLKIWAVDLKAPVAKTTGAQ